MLHPNHRTSLNHNRPTTWTNHQPSNHSQAETHHSLTTHPHTVRNKGTHTQGQRLEPKYSSTKTQHNNTRSLRIPNTQITWVKQHKNTQSFLSTNRIKSQEITLESFWGTNRKSTPKPPENVTGSTGNRTPDHRRQLPRRVGSLLWIMSHTGSQGPTQGCPPLVPSSSTLGWRPPDRILHDRPFPLPIAPSLLISAIPQSLSRSLSFSVYSLSLSLILSLYHGRKNERRKMKERTKKDKERIRREEECYALTVWKESGSC
jgi:hypothetical protein